MKKILLFTLFAAICFAAQLKIAAAANLSFVLNEIKDEFIKTNPNDEISITFGSSGKLVSQIKNGALYDVFLSADMGFSDALIKDNFSADEVSAVYAKGKVAMFSARGFEVCSDLKCLKNPKIKSIIIANPKLAPYGKASEQAFKNAGVYEDIKDKIIKAGSIGEALSQSLSAGDVGFVALSALKSHKLKKWQNAYKAVDSSLYEPISQGMIKLKNSQNSELAKKFYDFILSDKAKEIFKKYGYEI
ncbi:molybdate ABC transporter substrate-binding protein [Campylobacter magnus]|uniref:molybdate ABC transporter substrate-binding protein n=1 Tax=Campylobacter magnus TaxID=3026462 RepID=UPI0026DF2558|nr:molybdate ABC transporter substrate-binding protein [Campylobacter magnus]MDO2408111.1 molybdate ABC transporter substrate-binding protein [Campylobacter magnus]